MELIGHNSKETSRGDAVYNIIVTSSYYSQFFYCRTLTIYYNMGGDAPY